VDIGQSIMSSLTWSYIFATPMSGSCLSATEQISS
jgi:hypothetical protein